MAVDSVDCSRWEWAAQWFGDNVCEVRDKIGLIVGLVSVVLWAVAEIPQLVVNFIEGSSDGLSEGLLWLWVFSDVLDVVGCSISDTLPTMLITAWMYFIFTLLLLAQHIYYTRFGTAAGEADQLSESKQPLLGFDGLEVDDDLLKDLQQPSILQYRYPHRGSAKQHTHTVYGSLRNLSVRRSSSSRSVSFIDTGRRLHSSFVHRFQPRPLAPAVCAGSEPERPSTADAATIRSLRTASLPRAFMGASTASRVAAGMTLLATAALVGISTSTPTSSDWKEAGVFRDGNTAAEGEFLGISYAVWGAGMGWTMAVTFFMGRVPQVIKNWQRQSCAGLSVEMFLVVFSAAITYCASILIRVRSWSDLRPELPFLVDAAAGAVLDLVILVQFFLYRDEDEDSQIPSGEQHHCCSAEQVYKLASADARHQGIDSSSSSLLDPYRALHDKLTGLQSAVVGLPVDTQNQLDVVLVDSSLGPVDDGMCIADAGCDVAGPSLDIMDTSTHAADHHVDILVIDPSDQQSGTNAVSTSWNEDAVSMLSVATI